MGVVIQALIPAEAAVVVFTRHPVTGRTDQLLINAVRGLGEPMVSGLATPDEIVVDKRTRDVVTFTPGDDGERLMATETGLTHTADPATGPVLRDRSSTPWSSFAFVSRRPSQRRSTSKPPSPAIAGTSSRHAPSQPEVRMLDSIADAAVPAAPTPDFPVTWPVASDADRTWELDDMHTPSCLSPLAQDYGLVLGQGFAYRYDRLDLPIKVLVRPVNGYLYFSYQDIRPR